MITNYSPEELKEINLAKAYRKVAKMLSSEGEFFLINRAVVNSNKITNILTALTVFLPIKKYLETVAEPLFTDKLTLGDLCDLINQVPDFKWTCRENIQDRKLTSVNTPDAAPAHVRRAIIKHFNITVEVNAQGKFEFKTPREDVTLYWLTEMIGFTYRNVHEFFDDETLKRIYDKKENLVILYKERTSGLNFSHLVRTNQVFIQLEKEENETDLSVLSKEDLANFYRANKKPYENSEDYQQRKANVLKEIYNRGETLNSVFKKSYWISTPLTSTCKVLDLLPREIQSKILDEILPANLDSDLSRVVHHLVYTLSKEEEK